MFIATIVIAGAAAVVAVALLAPTLRNWGVDPSLASVREALNHRAAPRPVRVESSAAFAHTTFFEPHTQQPLVWYAITSAGDIELYDAAGRSPTSGEMLRPITTTIVQQLERRLKSREQEHVAEAERKAATARADAEIARARRSQQVVTATASIKQRDTPAAMDARAPLDLRAPSTRDAQQPPNPSTERNPSQAVERVAVPVQPAAAPDPNAALAGSERARRYNELVSDARALMDAGRYGEARAKAQRAIFVDPTRMSARSLWAEAQTRLDDAQLSLARSGDRTWRLD